MGKTVPSCRIALEWKIDNWKGFMNTLTQEEEAKASDMLVDMDRVHASTGGCALNPVLFEPMVMSLVLDLQKQIDALEAEPYSYYGRNPPQKLTLRNRWFWLGPKANLKPN